MATRVSEQNQRGVGSSAALLEIAAKLLREQGYTGTTMRRIADIAGIKAASIYHHFASKDEMVEHVLDRAIIEAIANVRQAMDCVPEGAPFEERFKTAIRAYLETANQLGPFIVATRQLLNQVPPDLANRHRAHRNELDALWTELLDRGYRDGAITLPARDAVSRMFMLGALNWTTEWIDLGKKSSDELAGIFTKLFFNGVATR